MLAQECARRAQAANPTASGLRPRLRSRFRLLPRPTDAMATVRHQAESVESDPMPAVHCAALRRPAKGASPRSPTVRSSAIATKPNTKSGTI